MVVTSYPEPGSGRQPRKRTVLRLGCPLPAEYVETLVVDPAELHPHPQNPNQGDVDVVRGSVRANGQYRSVIARRLPDGTLELLAGHTTTAAAGDELGKVRVEVVAADDATARRIVAADNQTARRAQMDEVALLALLDSIAVDGTPDAPLFGSGYTSSEREDLERMLNPPTLDDFAKEVGQPAHGDGWPTLHLKVPHHVASAWEGHLEGYDGDAPAALAALLGIDAEPPSGDDDE